MSFATDGQRRVNADTWPLYEKGFRVSHEVDGCRLRLIDVFANRNEDFGLHASEARAWEVARLLSGTPAPAIVDTGMRG